MAPVLEVVFVKPFGLVRKSRIIKSILRTFDGMDVKENLDSIFVSSVKEPFNIITSLLLYV